MALRLTVIGHLVLLLTMESNAVTTPTSECRYFVTYFMTSSLSPSMVPSISSACITAYNALFASGSTPLSYDSLCIAQCQSLFNLYATCTDYAYANEQLAYLCGNFSTQKCTALRANDSALLSSVGTACGNSTSCNPLCVTSIAALENFSGCCRYDALNGPKALCGQQPIGPCSSVLNIGNAITPSSECAYFEYYNVNLQLPALPSKTPSLDNVCRSALNAAFMTGNTGTICIPECQSLYNLYHKCFGVPYADEKASYYCGHYNKQLCSQLTASNSLSAAVATSCQSACGSSCLSAITALQNYSDCCYAYSYNGAEVLCGQQPRAPCSTIFNSGSTEIGINIFTYIHLLVIATLMLGL